MGNLLPDGSKYEWVGGVYVERDALRIAEKIHEYDPNLKVQYLEGAPAIGDPPFRVVERCRDGVERVMFFFWELDDRVLDRIKAHDTMRVDLEAEITKANRRAKDAQKKKSQELHESAREIVHAIAKSPKDTYVVNDEITGKKVKFSTTEKTK